MEIIFTILAFNLNYNCPFCSTGCKALCPILEGNTDGRYKAKKILRFDYTDIFTWQSQYYDGEEVI